MGSGCSTAATSGLTPTASARQDDQKSTDEQGANPNTIGSGQTSVNSSLVSKEKSDEENKQGDLSSTTEAARQDDQKSTDEQGANPNTSGSGQTSVNSSLVSKEKSDEENKQGDLSSTTEAARQDDQKSTDEQGAKPNTSGSGQTSVNSHWVSKEKSDEENKQGDLSSTTEAASQDPVEELKKLCQEEGFDDLSEIFTGAVAEHSKLLTLTQRLEGAWTKTENKKTQDTSGLETYSHVLLLTKDALKKLEGCDDYEKFFGLIKVLLKYCSGFRNRQLDALDKLIDATVRLMGTIATKVPDRCKLAPEVCNEAVLGQIISIWERKGCREEIKEVIAAAIGNLVPAHNPAEYVEWKNGRLVDVLHNYVRLHSEDNNLSPKTCQKVAFAMWRCCLRVTPSGQSDEKNPTALGTREDFICILQMCNTLIQRKNERPSEEHEGIMEATINLLGRVRIVGCVANTNTSWWSIALVKQWKKLGKNIGDLKPAESEKEKDRKIRWLHASIGLLLSEEVDLDGNFIEWHCKVIDEVDTKVTDLNQKKTHNYSFKDEYSEEEFDLREDEILGILAIIREIASIPRYRAKLVKHEIVKAFRSLLESSPRLKEDKNLDLVVLRPLFTLTIWDTIFELYNIIEQFDDLSYNLRALHGGGIVKEDYEQKKELLEDLRHDTMVFKDSMAESSWEEVKRVTEEKIILSKEENRGIASLDEEYLPAQKIQKIPVHRDLNAQQKDKKQVFISYSWAIKENVKEFVEVLRQKGIGYWRDDESMNRKHDLVENLVNGIDQSEYVMSFLTEGYLRSANCTKEVEYACKTNKTMIWLNLLENIQKADKSTKLGNKLNWYLGDSLYYTRDPKKSFKEFAEDICNDIFKTEKARRWAKK